MQTDSLNEEEGGGKDLNRGRGRETQTSFVQSMTAGWTRKQMKLTHGKGIIAEISRMSL